MVRAPKLVNYVGSPLTVHALNGYVYTGTLLAIDRHMNMVVSSCCCRYKESIRSLGLVVLRGEEVAFFTQDKDVIPINPPTSSATHKVKLAPPQKPVIMESAHKPTSTRPTKPSFVIPGLGRAVKSKIKG